MNVALHRLAVVMPAYNEEAGISEFLSEIGEHLAPLTAELHLVVMDDCSTDGTAAAAASVSHVTVHAQERNRGHGPTAIAAYRAGLALVPDLIVHVDGDGQFTGADLARLVTAWQWTGADVVHGVRQGRTDPWFRRGLTGLLRGAVTVLARRPIPDINTPLRAYRPEALAVLVDALGADAEIPHVHFSLAEARGGFTVRYLPVESIPRRGGDEAGTMWAARASILPPPRLRAFVGRGVWELWRDSIRPGARMRGVSAP